MFSHLSLFHKRKAEALCTKDFRLFPKVYIIVTPQGFKPWTFRTGI